MHNRYFSFCFQFVTSLFIDKEQKKVASWCIVYIWHTYWLCLWRHCYILLGTKWQPLRSCFRAFPACFFFFFSFFFILLLFSYKWKPNDNLFIFWFFLMLIQKLYIIFFLNIWTNMMLLRFSSSLNIMHQSIAIFLCLSAMFLLLFWPNDVAVDHFIII